MAVASQTRILPRMTLLLVRRFTNDNANATSRDLCKDPAPSIFKNEIDNRDHERSFIWKRDNMERTSRVDPDLNHIRQSNWCISLFRYPISTSRAFYPNSMSRIYCSAKYTAVAVACLGQMYRDSINFSSNFRRLPTVSWTRIHLQVVINDWTRAKIGKSNALLNVRQSCGDYQICCKHL